MKNKIYRRLAVVLSISMMCSICMPVMAETGETEVVEEHVEENTTDMVIEKNVWKGEVKENNRVYLDENGEKVIGLQEIEDKVYFFDEEGIAQTGWQKVDGVEYYFSKETGERYEECIEEIDGIQYSFNKEGEYSIVEEEVTPQETTPETEESGMETETIPEDDSVEEENKIENPIAESVQAGWIETVEGKKYLDTAGNPLKGMQTISGKLYFFDIETGVLQLGWITVGENRYYAAQSGELYRNQIITFGAPWYYMGSDGSVQKGYIKAGNGSLYYGDLKTGILKKSSWVETEEKRYYANEKAELYKNQFIKFGDIYYYMGSDGSVQKGMINVNNDIYYSNLDTGIVKKNAGWIDYKNNRYYTRQGGALFRNQFIKFGDIYYYMGSDGSVQKGVVQTANGVYYADPESGIIQNLKEGWMEKDGKQYYMSPNGKFYSNQIITFGNIWYYMGSDGSVQKGYTKAADGTLYYGNPETGILKRSGWVEIENKKYYANERGALYKNQIITFGDIGYCMGADGSVQYGAVTLNGVTYYTDEVTGIIQKKTGWIEKNGKKYYANEKGILYRNQIITFGDIWYCMGDDGSVQYGIGEAGGKLYHTDEQTGIVIKVAGWIEKGGNRYYSNAQGILYRNQFISFGSIYYYCRDDGAICYGKQVINGIKYQFDETGIMIKESGWGENEGKKYYKNPATGFPYKNQWVTFGQVWYYAGMDGLMVSGWHEINGARYYFYPETFVMARNVSIDGWEIGSDGKAGSTQYLKKKINEIKKYVSVPYQTGGTTPLGWDCSGFTMWALKYLGVNIPRLSFEQAVCGTAIDKNDMSKWKPGDILVYSSGGYAGHVALYLGDGMLMHALNYRWGTLIQGVEYYEKWDSGTTLTGVRRYL